MESESLSRSNPESENVILQYNADDEASTSIREVLPSISNPSMDLDDSGSGFYAKVSKDEETEVKKPIPPSEAHKVSSGIRIANEILQQVIRQATKATPVRKKRHPPMKSGWMKLQEVINNFGIDDETFKNILFNENLIVSSLEENSNCPTPIGGLSLDIQRARGGPLDDQNKKTRSAFSNPKFLVHLSSQIDFMGHNAGSRITAWVDRDLQTLEEKRREYIKLDDGIDQQVLYVSSQENFYYLRHDKKEDIFYSPERAANLICEGANFVLMRYLAIMKFIGTFEVCTVYIDGSLCRNIYECKGPSGGLINDQKMDVCKIYRTIIEECGIEHKSITLMTLTGQIIKQEWHSCDYILQINPLYRFADKSGACRIPLETRPLTDDLQLLSLYLDSKTSNTKVIENYMEDHPEIKDLLSDYVQTILQLKPEDIYEFTAKYFLAFTPALLPQSEYFEGPYNGGDDQDYEFWKYI